MSTTTPEKRGRIRREDIDALREKVSIEDIVSERVTLRQAGYDAMKGLCPFHDERTPSFQIRPNLGLWHCFGCDEGGDAISFVQRADTLSFIEAVEYLAGRFGVELRYEDGAPPVREAQPGRRQRLIDANQAAEAFFRTLLSDPEAQPARDVLLERHFDAAAADHFGVGYAPRSWDALLNHLRGLGFTVEEITAAGLVSQGNRGVYDRFRGRLMWPIRDITGQTIGFGARKLFDDDPGPKYLNTPETVIYKKSQVLYGLDLAKKSIAQGKKVIIVEGYTDVMAAHLAGETTAVATCGTAFGSGHTPVLRRLLGDTNRRAVAGLPSSGEVIFTFDGDDAGKKAALRAFGEDEHFNAHTYVAVTPGGMDPCDLRIRHGDQALIDMVNGRRPLFEFVIHTALAAVDLTTPEGRVEGLRAAAPILAGIKDDALRPEYVRQCAGWLGMPPAEVSRAVKVASTQPRAHAPVAKRGDALLDAPQTEGSAVPAPNRRDPATNKEAAVLEVVLQTPALAAAWGFDTVDPNLFTTPAYQLVHKAVRDVGGTRRAETMSQGAWLEIVREKANPAVQRLVTELAVAAQPEDRPEHMPDYARGVLSWAQWAWLGRRITELKAQMQRMSYNDPGYLVVFEQLIDLEGQREQIAAAQGVTPRLPSFAA